MGPPVHSGDATTRAPEPLPEEAELWRDFTVENRARLIERYQPLVYHIYRQLPHVPRDEQYDVVSEGTVALIEAADEFDVERGVKFITYAYMRIKGRMLDYLRRRALLPVSTDALEFAEFTRIIGFSEKVPAERQLEALRLAEKLMLLLTPAEERILRMMYQEGMSQDEVSTALGCTRANISILHKRALLRLRGAVAARPQWRLAFEP